MNQNTNLHPVDALLVGGVAEDIRGIRKAMSQLNAGNGLYIVGSTRDARSFLLREVPYSKAPHPVLVFIDADQACEPVAEFLAWLKNNSAQAGVKVIALTDSESWHDPAADCGCPVDGRIQKPFSGPKLARALMNIDSLSFQIVNSHPA